MRIISCSLRLFRSNARSSKLLFLLRRGKKKKVSMKTGCDFALEHFDTFYRPMFKELWPSIRISLLTRKKTSAVLNSYTDTEALRYDLAESGAYDILEDASKVLSEMTPDVISTDRKDPVRSLDSASLQGKNLDRDKNIFVEENQKLMPSEEHNEQSYLTQDTNEAEVVKTENDFHSENYTDLDIFIPAKNVYSERDTLRIQDSIRSQFTPSDVRVNITKKAEWTLPKYLRVMVYPHGDISLFPDPKGSPLTHFLMDAASVLPVIALDLQVDEHVLDLCAAPGGKTLSILQTQLPEKVTCNDLSFSRLSRLKNIIRYYMPKHLQQMVDISNRDGKDFNDAVYDKVLVDVPCNTDRHYLSALENNLFTAHRMKERIALPVLQKDLLVAGIKSCAPGGSVVYSTCTLSFAQNDGVIQQAIDEIWKTTNIDIMIEDLEPIRTMFQNTLNFYPGCRFGQLVVPSLSANFGPTYFCKINRRN